MKEFKKGIYRHYKGGFYRVKYLALHSEDLSQVVVYESCADGQVWVRPLEMFQEDIEPGIPRFEYLGKPEEFMTS